MGREIEWVCVLFAKEIIRKGEERALMTYFVIILSTFACHFSFSSFISPAPAPSPFHFQFLYLFPPLSEGLIELILFQSIAPSSRLLEGRILNVSV